MRIYSSLGGIDKWSIRERQRLLLLTSTRFGLNWNWNGFRTKIDIRTGWMLYAKPRWFDDIFILQFILSNCFLLLTEQFFSVDVIASKDGQLLLHWCLFWPWLKLLSGRAYCFKRRTITWGINLRLTERTNVLLPSRSRWKVERGVELLMENKSFLLIR